MTSSASSANMPRMKPEYGDVHVPAVVPGCRAAAPSIAIHACASSLSSRTAGSSNTCAGSGPRCRQAQRWRLAKGTCAPWTASTAITFLAHRVAPTPEQAVDAALARPNRPRAPFRPSRSARLMKSTTRPVTSARHRGGAAKVDTSRGVPSMPGHGCSDRAAGHLPAKRVSRHEGHVRHLSRQRRPHDLVGVFSCHDGNLMRSHHDHQLGLRAPPQAVRARSR